jgi:hypothetical protein
LAVCAVVGTLEFVRFTGPAASTTTVVSAYFAVAFGQAHAQIVHALRCPYAVTATAPTAIVTALGALARRYAAFVVQAGGPFGAFSARLPAAVVVFPALPLGVASRHTGAIHGTDLLRFLQCRLADTIPAVGWTVKGARFKAEFQQRAHTVAAKAAIHRANVGVFPASALAIPAGLNTVQGAVFLLVAELAAQTVATGATIHRAPSEVLFKAALTVSATVFAVLTHAICKHRIEQFGETAYSILTHTAIHGAVLSFPLNGRLWTATNSVPTSLPTVQHAEKVWLALMFAAYAVPTGATVKGANLPVFLGKSDFTDSVATYCARTVSRAIFTVFRTSSAADSIATVWRQFNFASCVVRRPVQDIRFADELSLQILRVPQVQLEVHIRPPGL